jgi:hypothetical protein
VGQVTGTSFEDRTARAGSACTYRVAALDAAGLRSEKSGTASATIPPQGGSGWGVPFTK